MSFQQGISGLNASAKNLDVIGHNVANANTYGAKSSRAEFAAIYANAVNGGGATSIGSSTEAGIGVAVVAVTQQFSQGSINTTGNTNDLAIKGSGFFQVSDGSTTTYTRNGQFQVSKDGNIVTNTGLKLLGYPADAQGTIVPGAAGPLTLPTAGIAPNVTSKMTVQANLNASLATTLPSGTPQIDFTNAATYNNATSATAYDVKGQQIAVSYYFQKAGNDTWNVYATANGSSVKKDGSGNPLPISSVTFAADGSGPTSPTAPVSFDIPASVNSVGAATVAITGVKLDLSTTTQYGSPFSVNNLTQDGFAAGQLIGLQVDSSGLVMASYSNDQTKAAGQVELASFRNVQGLVPAGNNQWIQSIASGSPVYGVPGSGNVGTLQAGALEESNVDLTGELVNMITAQRAYQANAQTIKTEDQILQTLVNLR